MKQTYIQLRPTLQTGDILLFSGKGLVSTLIKAITLSDISHVGMVYCIAGDVYVWESTSLTKGKSGVQISLLSKRLKTYIGKVRIRRLECNRDSDFYQRLAEFRQECKGKEYERNIWQLIASATIFRNNPDLSSIFCSELIAEAYKRLRLIEHDLPANEYTPADFTSRRGKVDRYLVNAVLSEEIEII